MSGFSLFGYTYAAAGRRLGVHRSRVSQLVANGSLATVVLDGRSYVSYNSLAAYMANRTRRIEGVNSRRLNSAGRSGRRVKT